MNSKRWLTLLVAMVMALSLVLVAACNGHEHDYQWDYNDTEHWKVCAEDGTIDESSRSAHRLINSVCECGYMHIHSYTDMDFDADQHWNICPVDGAIDANSYANHTFDANCACACGATNHDYGYTYTADSVPAPVANGGKLVRTCSKCNGTEEVSYDIGIASAEVVTLTNNGTYYVSGAAAGDLAVKFNVASAGRYALTLTDVVFPESDGNGAVVRSVADVLIDGATVVDGGAINDAYKSKMSFDSMSNFSTLTCNFEDEDVGATVELKLTFTNAAAIIPFALIGYTATEAALVPDGQFTAHFYNSNNWDSVSIHAWGSGGDYFGAWPGLPVTDVADGWYTVSFDVDAGSLDGATFGVIFNNGGNGAQTKDLFPTQNEVWVTVDSAMFYSRTEAVEHASKLKPIDSSAYFIVGKIQGQEDWSETTSDYSRVLPAENGYSVTLNLYAGDQFKVKQNTSGWDVEYGYYEISGPDTSVFSAGGAYGTDILVSKDCTVTITLNVSSGRLTLTVVA